jgi:hypothetical protein
VAEGKTGTGVAVALIDLGVIVPAAEINPPWVGHLGRPSPAAAMELWGLRAESRVAAAGSCPREEGAGSAKGVWVTVRALHPDERPVAAVMGNTPERTEGRRLGRALLLQEACIQERTRKSSYILHET